KNTIDNNGGRFWDILKCPDGQPDGWAVQAQASTYAGQLVAPGIQRAPNLARAVEMLKYDLRAHPERVGHYYRIWRYELNMADESPSAYQQFVDEIDVFITDYVEDPRAMSRLAGFIGPNQQKVPSSVVQRFRQAVTALPETSASQINLDLDYGLLSSELDEQKKAQGYLAFAAKYPQSSYTASAYQNAFDCEIEMKDVPGAESVFEKLAALDRERLDPLLTMAQLYIDQKTRVDRAVKLLDTA